MANKSPYQKALEKQKAIEERKRVKDIQNQLGSSLKTVKGSGYDKAVQAYLNSDPLTDRLSRSVTNYLIDRHNKQVDEQEKKRQEYLKSLQEKNKPIMSSMITENTGLGKLMQESTGIRKYNAPAGGLVGGSKIINPNYASDLQNAYEKYLEEIRNRNNATGKPPYAYYNGQYDGKSDAYSKEQRNAAVTADNMAQNRLWQNVAAKAMAEEINNRFKNYETSKEERAKLEAAEAQRAAEAGIHPSISEDKNDQNKTPAIYNPNFLEDAKKKAEEFLNGNNAEQVSKYYEDMLANLRGTRQLKGESGQYEDWTAGDERNRARIYIDNRESGLFDGEEDPLYWSGIKLNAESDKIDSKRLTEKGREAKHVIQNYFDGKATEEDLNELVYSMLYTGPLDGTYEDYKQDRQPGKDAEIEQLAYLIKQSGSAGAALRALDKEGVNGLGDVNGRNRYQDVIDDRERIEGLEEEAKGLDVISESYNQDLANNHLQYVTEKLMGEYITYPKVKDGENDIFLSYYYANNRELIDNDNYKYISPEPFEEYFWTPDQVETFNKFVNAGKYEEARAYKEGLSASALAARTNYLQNIMKTKASGENGWVYTFSTALMAPVTGLMGSIGAIGALLGVEEYKNPNAPIYSFQHQADAVHQVRSDLAGMGLQNLYETLTKDADNETAYQIGRTLYGIGSSILDNLVAIGYSALFGGPQTKLGAAMVQLIMSSEQTSSKVVQYLESDMSTTEACLLAIGNGIVEAITEKFSLDALVHKTGSIASYILKNSLVEGSEEVAADLLNMALDKFISEVYGHDSEFEKEIKALEAAGDKEALKRAWENRLQEMGISFVSGTLSGFALSGGYAAIGGVNNAMQDRRTAKELTSSERINKLLEAAGKVKGDENFNAAVERAKSILEENGALSLKEARDFVKVIRKGGNRLVDLTARDAMVDAVEEEIRRVKHDDIDLGDVAKTAEDIGKVFRNAAEAVVEMATGDGKITTEQKEAYQTIPEASHVLKEITGPVVGESSIGIKSKLIEIGAEARRDTANFFRAMAGEEAIRSNTVVGRAADDAKVASKEQVSMTAGNRVEGKAEIIYDGKFGELLRIEKGKVIAKIDGKEETIDPDDVLSTNKEMGTLLAFAQENQNIVSDKFANTLIAGIKASKDLNVKNYLKDAYQIRVDAYLNKTMPETRIEKGVAEMLYKASQEDAQLAEKQRLSGRQTITPGQGKATINGIDSESTTEWQNELSKLDLRRRSQVESLSMLYKKMGANVEFYKDASDSVYGEYNPISRSIRINLEGKDALGYHHMMVTAAHELTHFLERNSPKEYKALREYVLSEYQKQGYSVSELVQLKVNQYADIAAKAVEDAKKKNEKATIVDALTINGAIAEIVADSCDRVLNDEKLINQLAQDNHGLYNKIKGYVQNFIARFKAAARGINESGSWYSAQMKDMRKLADLWGVAWTEATGYAESHTAEGSAASAKSLAGRSGQGYASSMAFRAEEMARQGIDEATITKETGAIKGFRGRWWKPIDNTNFHLKTLIPKGEMNLNDYYDAKELYSEYPALKNVRVRPVTELGGAIATASIDGFENVITINTNALKNATREDVEDVLQHEIQHVIQRMEGSNNGANSGLWNRVKSALKDSDTNQYRDQLDLLIDEYDDADGTLQQFVDLYMKHGTIPANRYVEMQDAIENRFENMAEEDFSRFQSLLEKAASVEDTKRNVEGGRLSPMDLYMRTVGEIEARAASRRGTEQYENIDYFGAVALEDFYDEKTGGYAFDPNYGRLSFSASEIKANPELRDVRYSLADPQLRKYIQDRSELRINLLKMERTKILRKYGINGNSTSFAEETNGKKIRKDDTRKLDYIERTIAKLEDYKMEAMGLDENDLGIQYVKAFKEMDMKRMNEILLQKMETVAGIVPYRAPYTYDKPIVRDLAKRIKRNDMGAIRWAAGEMANLVPENAVLVPMPPHEGKVKDDTDTLLLAQEISKLTKRPVMIALEGESRMSRKEAKDKGIKLTAEDLGMRQVKDIPEGMIPIFVDNVVASGETAKAAHDAFGSGITLALAKSTRSAIRGVKNATPTFEVVMGNFYEAVPLNQRFDLDAEGVANVKYSVAQPDGTNMETAKIAENEYEAQAIQDMYPSSIIKLKPYQTRKQQETVISYLGSVDPAVLDMAKKAKNNKNRWLYPMNMGEVSEREAKDIQKETGIDVRGYQHTIDKNFFNHVERRHGSQGKADHFMEDLNDVARVMWVVNNYDKVSLDDKFKDTKTGYRDSNNQIMKKIVYRKAIDGSIYVVEAVGENSKKALHFIGMNLVSEKALRSKGSQSNVGSRVPDASNGSPGFTSETGHGSATDNIINQEQNSVKQDETGNDIRYSVAQLNNDYMEAAMKGDIATAQRLADEAAKSAGYIIHAYHGTGRADRVGNVFRPDRATSGPMAFFTDNREIAENYSRTKVDTSIAYDDEYATYESQFRAKKGGKSTSLIDLYYKLNLQDRLKIRERAKHIRSDWDGDGSPIYDEETTEANGGWEWQVKEAKGNIMRALVDQWLNSGNLFNEESQFLKVLELAGVNEALKNAGYSEPVYMNPDARYEKVYDTYLKILNPFDTGTEYNEDFIRELDEWWQDQDESIYERETANADGWDKNSVSYEDWTDHARRDFENGTTHAWTSIPDFVTDFLKSKGYDGIKDIGGKQGGQGHTVWIPFSGEQVKSSEAITYDDKGEIIPLTERFNEKKNDIRYSLSGTKDFTDEEALRKDMEGSRDGKESLYGDHKQFSVRVKDPEMIAFLENQEHITTYKTMQLIDGKLYPPMAAVVAGSKEDYSEFGKWEQATEHPELIKSGNNFTLNKGEGKGSLSARYNPYMHSSNLVLNDQFSSAYDRPNLVTVECIVPVSETNSGYHAEFAKDGVGWHPWHTGPVAGQVRKAKGLSREVFLSRWIKPVRKLSDTEVADKYAELVKGTDIEIPDNVVYPSLLKALEEKGVPIKNSGLVPGRAAAQKSVEDRVSQMAVADVRPDASTWIRNLDENDGMLSKAEQSIVTKFKGKLDDVEKTRAKINDIQDNLKTAEGDEARKLKINLKTENSKLLRQQTELSDLIDNPTYQGMQKRYQRMIDNVISGRTQEEVDSRVDELKRQISELRGIASDAAARAEELSKDRGQDIIRSYFPKTTLHKAAVDIKKHFMTSMTTEEIENEFASMTLRMANGDPNVGADVTDFAKRMLGSMQMEPELDWDVVEKMRGRTFVLSDKQWEEMKYAGYTPQKVRSLLKGTGIKFGRSKTGALDGSVWHELTEEFPELDSDINGQDEGIQLLELIVNDKNFTAGTAEVTEETVGESTFDLIGRMAGIMPPVIEDARVKKIIENLESYVKTMSGDAAAMEAKISELTEKLRALEGQSRDVSRATNTLRNQMDTAIEYFKARTQDQQATHTADELEALRKELESDAAKRLIAEQQKWRDKIEASKKLRDLTKDKTKIRGQISRLYARMMKRLVEETDDKNIPERFKPIVRAALRSILENEVYGDKRITEIPFDQISRQKKAFDIWDSREGSIVDLSVIEDEEAQDTIMEAIEMVRGGIDVYKALGRGYSMPNIEQEIAGLKQAQEGITTIYDFIKAQTTVDLNGRRMEVQELAYEVDEDAKSRAPHREVVGSLAKPVKTFSKNVYWGNTTPEYFFRRLKNRGLSKIWDEAFHNGENRSGLLTEEFRKKFADIAEKFGYSSWDMNRRITLKLSNEETVTLTAEQAMSLYATYLREKTLGLDMSFHLSKGGFVFEEDAGKMLLGRQAQKQVAHKFYNEDFEELQSKMTEQEKGYANAFVELLSKDGSELGNDASMRMYGIKKYKETYYFPFMVWEGVKTKNSSAGSKISPTNNNRAAHQGFTKRRVNNAGNAVMIRPFTEVCVEHINQMITYNTMGSAIESLNKVLNFKIDEAAESENMLDATKRSLETVLTEYYGENAVDYIRTLLQDMNGGVTQDNRGSTVEKLLSIFKKNAVSGSLSVALQQPLSYIRASMMINPKYLAAAMNPATFKGSYQEMLENSGIAVIKKMGRFDMNFGESAKEYMMPEAAKTKGESTYEKVTDTVNALPELMDRMTWTRIWTACKLEQAADNPGVDTSSAEFLKKVADRFNSVIRLTQVYDSTLVKSSMMRSRNWTARTITAFRAEPTLTANMLVDAWQNRKTKGGKKMMGAALGTYYLSAILQAAVKAIMGAGRTPDEKKTFLENFAYKFAYNFIGEANPLSLIPGYDNIVDALSGNDINDNAYGVIKQIYNMLVTTKDWITKGSENVYRSIEDTAGQLTQIVSGIPLKNLMRDGRAIYNWMLGTYADRGTQEKPGRKTSGPVIKYQTIDTIMKADLIGAINGFLGDAGYKTDNTSYYGRIWNAEKIGEHSRAEEMKEYLRLGKGVKEDTLKSGINKAMKQDESASSTVKGQYLIDNGTDNTSFINDEYKDGRLTAEEYGTLYKQIYPEKTKDDLYWQLDRLDYEKESGTTEGYSKYRDLYDAVENNKATEITAAVKKLMDHGTKASSVQTQITKQYKDAYLALKAGSAEKVRMKDAIIKALKATGMTAEAAKKKIDSWK